MGLQLLSAYKGNQCNGNCNVGGRGGGDGHNEDGIDSVVRARVVVMAAANVTAEAAAMVIVSEMALVMRRQRRGQQWQLLQ